MAKKGPFLEFLGERLTEDSAGTYTEVDIATPTSRTEHMAMLIHQVVFDNISDMDALADDDKVIMQLTKSPKGTVVFFNDNDLIARSEQVFKITTTGATFYDKAIVRTYNPPILYAKSKIHFGIQATGQSDAHSCAVQIGYTIENVSESDFINSLTD